MENRKKEFTTDLFNTITSNGCREMTEARFNEALNEYKQSILTLVDDLIVDETLYGWNHSAKVLTELKQKIETL